MIFTSLDYLIFVIIAFSVYWCLPRQGLRNGLLLFGSYVFYGYVHPWFCFLLAGTTAANYLVSLAMVRFPRHKQKWLFLGVTATLAHLGAFKYFGFFAENLQLILGAAGVEVGATEMDIFLPVGISFYSFQTLGYTIDVYRGSLAPRRNLLDFALFVSFFPQLVAGPIERAKHLLPQFEEKRPWSLERFFAAWPLLITGYLKKMVVADNAAVYANKVFALEHPSILLLAAGSAAFALQIYADFSAYTDIARGSARLFGFELMRNFNAPYLAVSPSDFWRRWHISFSTWIRDYLYIPLGGSRAKSRWKQGLVLVVALGLSGLWHGPAWHFIAWGVFHGLLLFLYRLAGFGGRWEPKTLWTTWGARGVMMGLTLLGWALFRAPSMTWLHNALFYDPQAGLHGPAPASGLVILLWTALLSLPFSVLKYLDDEKNSPATAQGIILGAFLVLIAVFTPEAGQDFIYFQF